MATYESAMHHVPKDLLDGTWGMAVKVKVMRYDQPDADPITVGTDTVRALSLKGATSKAQREIARIAARDKDRRSAALAKQIQRLKNANAPPGDNDLTTA